MTCKYPINSKSYKFCLGCSDIDCCEEADTSIISMPEIQFPKNITEIISALGYSEIEYINKILKDKCETK